MKAIILTPQFEAYLKSKDIGTKEAEAITGKSRWSINRLTKGLTPPLRNRGGDTKTKVNLFALLEWFNIVQQSKKDKEMKAQVKILEDGSAELIHNGTVEHFTTFSNMRNRMQELNIDVKLSDVITE